MNASKLRLKHCIGGILLAAASASAIAAETTTALEEIVVTAQKRTESLQDVPIAVTAFTSETRDLVGIETVQDLTLYTPGITYIQSLDRMSVRGVGRSTNNLSIDPSVATYRDGFYSSFNRVADSSTLFIKQVEVLRGPQGTLYGRNSIGGALNITSPRPTSEFSAEARAEAASFQAKSIEGVASGPITDWLRFRIGAGSYRQDAGFIQSINGHEFDGYGLKDNTEFEGQLAANIGDKVDLWMRFGHREWDSGYGTANILTPYPTNNVTTNPTNGAAACRSSSNAAQVDLNCNTLYPVPLYNTATPTGAVGTFSLNPATPQFLEQRPGVTDPRKWALDDPSREHLRGDHVVVFEAINHLGFADLKYVGGYYEYKYDLVGDGDGSDRKSYVYTPPFGSPVTVSARQTTDYQENKHYYSNEVNLISTNDGPLQYVFGLYQYHERFNQPTSAMVVGQSQYLTPFTLAFTPATPNPSGNYFSNNQYTVAMSEAVFTQFDWKFADTLKATVGVRYSRDRREVQESERAINWDPTFPIALGGGVFITPPAFDITTILTSPATTGATPRGDGFYERHLSSRSHATTGTAGVDWTPMEGALGYFKYTRGYKDAGINAGNFAANPYTNPEYIDALEAGWKQNVGSQVQVNVSAYYYKYLGAQYPLTLIRPPSPPFTAIFNIDEKIYGAEFETRWAPIDNLQFWLNYTYLNAKFTDENTFFDAIAGAAVPVKGDPVPGSPKNKVSLNVTYAWHFQAGSLTPSLSYFWRDKRTGSVFTDPGFIAPSYGQVDARITWTDTDNRYSVIAWVRNALDKLGYDYVTIANSSSGGFNVTDSFTPPRQFGLQVQYRIGAAATAR